MLLAEPLLVVWELINACRRLREGKGVSLVGVMVVSASSRAPVEVQDMPQHHLDYLQTTKVLEAQRS